ncbi:ribosome biogenesis GTP-binding protein YihA/YsxC [Natronogracilivirga saccharolytica]|uniref:Probable GTP-binding protein EngB n=1 Tax=Natronogracilivirga saccharolytica TaxID=2812953 RepID=A0A8J7UT18_9BACT|nr:ribosome biogenesis GTP-binding protein YihA/YsxC [Natronogracilivirga saccharolytica]MBP3192156.1 YihA family ribosome biogenesis GTP-binding protein [Natronogracilivirga saccharolytica]
MAKPVKKAEYLLSAPDLDHCPAGDKPEICFAGRSNVGKSSLINALTRRKRLAHTSNSPGKTRNLNYYVIDDSWYLVDLPGYGYAKISKKEQARWGREMKRYLLERKTLELVVVIVDIRHKPSVLDEEFMFWLAENGIPFCIILNKTDKISKTRVLQQKAAVSALLENMNIEVPVFTVSAQTPETIDDFFAFAMDFMQDAIKP